MSHTVAADIESQILERVFESDTAPLTADVARRFLSMRFDGLSLKRIDELAEKNRQGIITRPERELLEGYLRVGSLLNLVHAKARCALAETHSTDS